MGYRDQGGSHLACVQSHFFHPRDIMSNLFRTFRGFSCSDSPHEQQCLQMDNPDLGNKRHEFWFHSMMFVMETFSGTEFNCSNSTMK